MEILLFALALTVFILSIKVYLLKKSIKEINEGFSERLENDTNTPITTASHDSAVRSLASSINPQLKRLRYEMNKFHDGNAYLKNTVTNISHDLRTPLTAIFGYLDLLENESMSENAKRYLGIIRERSEVMKDLTTELFKYTLITSTDDDLLYEDISLNIALEESIAAFYADLKKREITPKISLTEEKVIRHLDKASLMRIFSNILSNAVKYSGGDLEISLTSDGEITFSNTAPSLSETETGKLFDRFFTVETARKSTGIGLAIARHLTEIMGGEIGAEYKNEKLYVSLKF